MKRPISILLWMSLYLGLGSTVVAVAAYLNPPGAEQKYYPWESCLAEYSQRLLRYQFDDNHHPQAVIVGSSFAASLGEFNGIRNLGLRGTRLKEHAQILGYCREGDVPLYMVSIREIAIRHWPARLEITDDTCRHRQILKGFCHDSLRLRERYIPPSKESILQRQVALFSGERGDFARPLIDISPLFELRKQHSNIVFILAPPLLTNDTINCVHQGFENAITDTELPVVNFSRIVPEEFFLDLLHLKPEGIQIVRQAISNHAVAIHPNLL